MMYGLYNGYGGWGSMMGFFGGGLMMLLFWGVVIWLVVSLVRGNFGKGHNCHICGHNDKEINEKNTNSALEILKERYAKGEIDKNEFEEKKKDLS